MKHGHRREPKHETTPAIMKVNRRHFLKFMGRGITILFFVKGMPLHAQRRRPDLQYPSDFNAYLQIKEDGRISCFTGKIEMGQGIATSFAQMLAEELDIPLNRVDMVMGDTALCPPDTATVGSRSTEYFGPYLRRAAAEARAILLELAAEHLETPVDQLEPKEGVIFDKVHPQKKVSYAQLVKGKKIQRHLKKPPSIKHHSVHTVSGQPADRIDGQDKVTGKAIFAGDVRLPEMLYARLLRPPSHGARLLKVDTSETEKISGIIVVKEKDLIAVLHRYPDEAERALRLMQAHFEPENNSTDNHTIFQHLLLASPPGEIFSESGNLSAGKKQAVQVLETRYYNHYVAHAPIEPHTALAYVEGKKATIWVSTQAPFWVRDSVAQELGIPPKNVRVITPFVGGGFGGKTRNLETIEAVRLSKITGKPVQVAWSRAEEFFYDTFRPAAIIDIQAGLNKNNHIVFWDDHIYYAGTRSSQPIYNIPHYRVQASGGGWRSIPGTHPFSTGAWRGPGSNTNVFAIESHIDMLANKARMNPLSFRRKNLTDKRMLRVLDAAAEQFGHSFQQLPSRKGYGMACTDYLGTYVAAMAEIEAEAEKGIIRVKRIVCAQDSGEVINPEGVKMQIEGGLTMGLGYVLTEEIQFRGGEILNKNFDSYELPRFSWTPEIEVVLVDNPDRPPEGCGEPAITCSGALISNALFDATGIRLNTLPLTPERVKKALSSNQQ